MRLVLIGLVAGFFSALFGVGGGIVIVPLLLLYCSWEARRNRDVAGRDRASPRRPAWLRMPSTGMSGLEYAALVGLPAALSPSLAPPRQQRLTHAHDRLLFAAFLTGIAIWLFFE